MALVVMLVVALPAYGQEVATAQGGIAQGGIGQRGGGQRGPVGGAGGDGTPGLGRFFFSPNQVLRSADAIELSEDQADAVRELMEVHQQEFAKLRFELGNEMTRMAALAVEHPVDQDGIMGQLENVLGLEAEIKRLQMTMLIGVKNLLSPEQQAQLRSSGGSGLRQRSGQGSGIGSDRGPGFRPGPRSENGQGRGLRQGPVTR
jgi:Spy/CpxP family protein refolding chaperone